MCVFFRFVQVCSNYWRRIEDGEFVSCCMLACACSESSRLRVCASSTNPIVSFIIIIIDINMSFICSFYRILLAIGRCNANSALFVVCASMQQNRIRRNFGEGKMLCKFVCVYFIKYRTSELWFSLALRVLCGGWDSQKISPVPMQQTYWRCTIYNNGGWCDSMLCYF